jgi:hypothetical protein
VASGGNVGVTDPARARFRPTAVESLQSIEAAGAVLRPERNRALNLQLASSRRQFDIAVHAHLAAIRLHAVDDRGSRFRAAMHLRAIESF